MNNLGRVIKFAINANAKQNIFSASKNFFRPSSITTWNKDWAPGPYPKTKEERIAAAKKYNMLPEDYEPYPEEEGYGDYPKFPATHMENRSDHELYDFPILKRNFGEPMHPDFDICLEDKVNFQREYPIPVWKMFAIVVSVVTAYSWLVIYDKNHPADKHRIPKQYPYTGIKSYTFEPAV